MSIHILATLLILSRITAADPAIFFTFPPDSNYSTATDPSQSPVLPLGTTQVFKWTINRSSASLAFYEKDNLGTQQLLCTSNSISSASSTPPGSPSSPLLPSGLSLNHNNINELHLPGIHIYCPSQFGQTLHNTVIPNSTLPLALGLGLGISLVVFAAGVLFLASEKEEKIPSPGGIASSSSSRIDYGGSCLCEGGDGGFWKRPCWEKGGGWLGRKRQSYRIPRWLRRRLNCLVEGSSRIWKRAGGWVRGGEGKV
ncbi:hypothetical protein F5882DRAFT_436473 [Hyaloscypha sp. PMI_1271]|nr:hypothetical protein F5882DRAFT_436473 [Hyaloscypha sp. PMI_1271]